jgi:hypothetical protein
MQARVFAVGLVLIASAASASQFQAFDRAAQVRASDVVLKGHVTSLRSEWDESGSEIHTFADVAVDEVWKGLPETDHITVRTLGGTVDEVGLAVEGAAQFAMGERVLLFLQKTDDVYQPVGMMFGKYSVEDSGPVEFLIGSLPPKVTGAQQFEVITIATDDLRLEVDHVLEEESR